MTYTIEQTGDTKRNEAMRDNPGVGITPVDSLRMAYLKKTVNNIPNRLGSPWASRITALDSLRMSY
jgi:hypothetical protein